jgi:two-component sensor histidine kinase
VKLVARLEDGERAVFEVIDNGIARGGIALPPNPQPLGLQLVRGLVTSELGGKFSMNLKDEGGMIARIAFPIGEGNER